MNAITSDEGRDWVEPASESQDLRVRTLNPISDPHSKRVSPMPVAASHTNARRESGTRETQGVVEEEQTAAPAHFEHDPWLRALDDLSRVSASRLFYAVYAKRVIDLVLATLLVILCAPILIVAAVWIVLDSPGHAFFAQQRIGRGGKPFTLYKLRTMLPSDSDRLVWMTDEQGAVRHKTKSDPRVTRPGKWLRRTSIDELPQLLNVIRGDMSLIGPRPELPEIISRYQPWQHARHIVRPGLSGWWQVSGRSDSPMHENTDLDIYYIEHLSPRLDLAIAVKTVGVVLKGLGAF